MWLVFLRGAGHGVPQGLVLGPTVLGLMLLTIFVDQDLHYYNNNIELNLSIKPHIFI